MHGQGVNHSRDNLPGTATSSQAQIQALQLHHELNVWQLSVAALLAPHPALTVSAINRGNIFADALCGWGSNPA
jgi:hypothetical protein